MALTPTSKYHIRVDDEGRYLVCTGVPHGSYTVVGTLTQNVVLQDQAGDEVGVAGGGLKVTPVADRRVFRATGAAAIAETITAAIPFFIESVRLHLSAAGGAVENFTAQIDGAAVAAVYDTVLLAQDMNAATDVLWVPEQPVYIALNDELDFAYNNANTRTWGLEVVYSLEA